MLESWPSPMTQWQQPATSIKPIKNDSTLSCRHAVQRINSSHPSQAALVRLEWELTFSRISHFLPVFIRNLGHDSSDPSCPEKHMHAKGGQSPRSLCSFLSAFLLSAHLSSNVWLPVASAPRQGHTSWLCAVHTNVVTVVAQSWAQRPWWNSCRPVYLQRDFL